MRTLLQCGMRLHAIGECAKSLLAHSPTALSELKPRISLEIIIQNEKKLDSFYLQYMGWIKTKNHLTLLSLYEMLSLKTDVFVPTERNQQKIFRKI